MGQKLILENSSSNFTKIPNELIEDERFYEYNKYGLYAKLLIMNLYRHGEGWSPTRSSEAKMLGVSQGTLANRVIPVAKKLGWLSITEDSPPGRNYTWSITIPKNCQPVTPGETGVVSPGETLSKTIFSKTNSSENDSEEAEPEKRPEEALREIAMETPEVSVKLAREYLRKETITLSQAKAALRYQIPEEYVRMSETPFFALKLSEVAKKQLKENYTVATLWASLREDIHGVPAAEKTNKEFTKNLGIASNLLKKYSYQQIRWTMLKIVLSNKGDLPFLVEGGPQKIEFFVKKYASEYRAISETNLRVKNVYGKIEEQTTVELPEVLLLEEHDAPDENTGRLLSLLGWSNEDDGK